MVDTLFRDGNNNLQTLKTLTASDGSTLPQSAPSDSTGNPYGTANPLPVTVAGTVNTLQTGQGPAPINISISVVAASDHPTPDLELNTRQDDILDMLVGMRTWMQVLCYMFASQCGDMDSETIYHNIQLSNHCGGNQIANNATY